METAVDKGWSWILLTGVFFTNTLTFGFMQCLGVFYVDWQKDIGASSQAVGWISSVYIAGFGISGLLSSFISTYVSCRWQGFVGGALAAASLSCSYWTTHISHLYIIMGVSGFGAGLSFTNGTVVLAFYFKKRLALANGLGSSGSGIGMIILAPLIRYLNDEYSWRGAMTICGAILANICVFTALFRMTNAENMIMTRVLKLVDKDDTKLPLNTKLGQHHVSGVGNSQYRHIHDQAVTYQSSTKRWLPQWLSIVRKHFSALVKTYKSVLSIRFLMMCVITILLAGFAYMAAIMFFVSNAITLGVSKTDAAILLSVFGICSGAGRIVFGPIIDNKVMLPSQMGSLVLAVGGTACLIGSVAETYVALAIFSAVLGLSAPLYNIIQFLILKDMVGVVRYKQIFGINVILWNTAGLASLPILGHIHDSTGNYAILFYIAGSLMILNSIVNIMDPIWQSLDIRFQIGQHSDNNLGINLDKHASSMEMTEP